MVTIIKPGTKKIAKCNKCGCEFSYEDEDKKIHLHKTYVLCPQCNEEYIIEQTKVAIVTTENSDSSIVQHYNDEYYKCMADR